MPPNTKEEILSFLGLAGNLSAWITSFSLLACPLYEVKGPLTGALDSTKPVMPAFSCLRDTLQTSALAFPDTDQPLSCVLLTNGECLWG